MEKELLEKMKKEMLEAINAKQKMQDALTEMEKLKENPAVQRYIELSTLCSVENLALVDQTSDHILSNTIARYDRQAQETNGIYFCLGKGFYGYKDEEGEYYISNSSLYHRDLVGFYRNIENISDSYIIPQSECDEFERTHTVIFATKGIDALEEYKNVQKVFFDTAINDTQEKAVQKVLEMGKK